MSGASFILESSSRIAGLNFNIHDIIAKIIPSRKSISIGVDIYPDRIRMIKAMGASTGTPILLGYKCVPVPHEIKRHTIEYNNFLKSELNKFYPARKKPAIWNIISGSKVQIQFLLIPKTKNISIEKAVYWAVNKEGSFDKERSIIDYRVNGEVKENGNTKLSIMVYSALKDEIEEKTKLFSSIGMPLTGISFMPFAFANILRAGWISNPGTTNAVLFIGNDFSSVDIYFQGKLVMTREFKSGTKSHIDSLTNSFRNRAPSSPELEEEDVQIHEDLAQKALFRLSQDSPPLSEEDEGFGLKKEEVFEMILPALQRLARQVQLTIESYENNPKNEKVEKLFISGAMEVYTPIVEYISSHLGIEGIVLDPLDSQVVCKDLRDATERIAYIPSLGIALSDKTNTPNILYTQKERNNEALAARFNLVAFAIFMIAVLILSVIFAYQRFSLNSKKVLLASLNQQLAEYKPLLDKEEIQRMGSDAKKRQEVSLAYGKRYLGLAVINELTAITPENIHIINLKTFFGEVLSASKNVNKKGAEKNLVVEGIVQGEHHTLESAFLEYIMNLRDSRVFSKIEVQSRSFASSNIGVVFNFTIKIEILS